DRCGGTEQAARGGPADRAWRQRWAAMPGDRCEHGRISYGRSTVAATACGQRRDGDDQPRRARAPLRRAVRVRAADRPPGHARRAAAARSRATPDRDRQPRLAGGRRDAGPQAVRRVLSLSTLYPNTADPRFGTFVARSLEALAARGDWHVTLLN